MLPKCCWSNCNELSCHKGRLRYCLHYFKKKRVHNSAYYNYLQSKRIVAQSDKSAFYSYSDSIDSTDKWSHLQKIWTDARTLEFSAQQSLQAFNQVCEQIYKPTHKDLFHKHALAPHSWPDTKIWKSSPCSRMCLTNFFKQPCSDIFSKAHKSHTKKGVHKYNFWTPPWNLTHYIHLNFIHKGNENIGLGAMQRSTVVVLNTVL